MTDSELRRSLGMNQPAEKIQPNGYWKAIALMVQFTDKPATTAATYFDTMLFARVRVRSAIISAKFPMAPWTSLRWICPAASVG